MFKRDNCGKRSYELSVKWFLDKTRIGGGGDSKWREALIETVSRISARVDCLSCWRWILM
jgi:hypothetical protein